MRERWLVLRRAMAGALESGVWCRWAREASRSLKPRTSFAEGLHNVKSLLVERTPRDCAVTCR